VIHLGINYGHNATIAVVRDGQLVFCQSEERFNRIKNSTGFPVRTLAYIHEHIAAPEEIASATLFQNTVFGYLWLEQHGFESIQYAEHLEPSTVEKGWRRKLVGTQIGWRLKHWRIARRERDAGLRAKAHEWYAKALGMAPDRVRYVDHHLSHTWSAVPNLSPAERHLVFTLDGWGDWCCATVSIVEDGQVRVLDRTDYRHSLGVYYSAVTALLGMKPNEHEFKVMGLAPYARPDYYEKLTRKLRELITVDGDGHWNSRVLPPLVYSALEEAARGFRFDNVAGAIQQLTEELILDWVHLWIERTGVRSIAVAGGVFMNVKACQRLAASSAIERMFVVPSAGDESCAVGAAFHGAKASEPGIPLVPMRDLYLGVAYSDGDAEAEFASSGAAERYEISRPENINAAVAALLAEDKVVARCSGRMEYGARALGNRSILANPSRMENLNFINEAIKSRDFWMPFTPSILAEDMPRYIRNHERIFAPYMCITFDSTQAAARDLVAAIHPRDRTVRPQCVLPDWNPEYHALITEFKRLTGIGGVLNTSFNLHGEPNVCSPKDALHTVDESGLEYLALGNFLLRKRSAR
jgi:carbamoyltransferase